MSSTAKPRTLALLGDETGCNLWRVWWPFGELQRRGFVADYAPFDGCPRCGAIRPEELRQSNKPWDCVRCAYVSRASDVLDLLMPYAAAGTYNLLVTPRIAWQAEGVGDRWIRTIHKAGLAWIFEVDDDVFSPGLVARQMRLFETERAKGEKQLEMQRVERIRLLSQCDGISVSTQRLKTIVQSYVPEKPVYVLPNSVDVKQFRWVMEGVGRIPELVNRITIGWAGGTRDDIDILPLAEAWAVIAKRHPEVMFVVQGHIPQVLIDAVPKHRRVTLPWLPLGEYPKALVNFDIGCCSVAPLVFNTSKSAIKWYEMSLAGAACVVSKTVYGREVTDGVNALVAETVEDWVEHLSRLVKSKKLRQRIVSSARRTVTEKHSIEANWWRWAEAWSEVVETFHAKPQLVLSSAG